MVGTDWDDSPLLSLEEFFYWVFTELVDMSHIIEQRTFS